MLRYRADIRTLGILGTYAVLFVAGWVLWPSGPLLWAWVVVLSGSSWLCAVVAHNTVHCPVFTKRWMNRAFQVWVSLSYGFPISEYIPGHNLSNAQDNTGGQRTVIFTNTSPEPPTNAPCNQ